MSNLDALAAAQPGSGAGLHWAHLQDSAVLQLAAPSSVQGGQVLSMLQYAHLPAQGGGQQLQILQLPQGASAPPVVLQPQAQQGLQGLGTQPVLATTADGQLVLQQGLQVLGTQGLGTQQVLSNTPIFLNAGQLLSLVTTQQGGIQLLQPQTQLSLQNPQMLQVGGITLPLQQTLQLTDASLQQNHYSTPVNLSIQQLSNGITFQQLPAALPAPSVLPLDLRQDTLDTRNLPALPPLAPLTTAPPPVIKLKLDANNSQLEGSSKSAGWQGDSASPLARQQASSRLRVVTDTGSPSVRLAADSHGLLQPSDGQPAPREKGSGRGAALTAEEPAAAATAGNTDTSYSAPSAARSPAAARPPGRPPTKPQGQPRKRTRPSHHLNEAENRLAALTEQHARLQSEHSAVLPRALVLNLAVKSRNQQIACLRLLEDEGAIIATFSKLLSHSEPSEAAAGAATNHRPSDSTSQPGSLIINTTKTTPGTSAAGQDSSTPPGRRGGAAADAHLLPITPEQTAVFQHRRAAALALFATYAEMECATEDRLRAVFSRVILSPNTTTHTTTVVAAAQGYATNALVGSGRPSPMDVLREPLTGPTAAPAVRAPHASADAQAALDASTGGAAAQVADTTHTDAATGNTAKPEADDGDTDMDGGKEGMLHEDSKGVGTRNSGVSANASGATVIHIPPGLGGVGAAAEGPSVVVVSTTVASSPARPVTTLTFNDASAGVPLSALLHSPQQQQLPASLQTASSAALAGPARPAANLAALSAALPLIFLCNANTVGLMGKLLVCGAGDADAAAMSAPPGHWQRVLALVSPSAVQLQMLSELQRHVLAALQKQDPVLKDWSGCLARLMRLETSKKAQHHLVQLGGPLLKGAELTELTHKLTASSASLCALVAEVLLTGIFTQDQVSVLLTSSWPFFPDLLGMVEVAASQVAAVMGAAAAQPQPQQLQLPAPASNPPLA